MKTSSLLILGLAGLSLSACGATSGGVAQSLAQQAAMRTVTPAPAQAVSAESEVTADPIIVADAKCETIAAKMAEADTTIANSQAIIAKAGQSNVAGQAVASGASTAAVHSGAAGALAKVPFGGFFAKAAMDKAANSGRKKAAKAQKELDKAVLRKAKLSGLYAGRNCEG
ncbi:hypothetical protein [Litorimonas haliclonae]|uniref:hypothetical protein n=1 Tax=Litorimonas haliclonae TaxID=2081977 RepID=UPI0039EEC565